MSRVLVTGGDRNLGLAVSNHYSMHGHDVTAVPTDVMLDGWDAIDNYIGLNKGYDLGYDYVINNFGYNYLAWIGDSRDELYKIMEYNVNTPYRVVDAIKTYNSRPARVINVASMTYRVAQRCSSMYCASKAAIVQMTRVMARELAPEGWVVNCIAPGKIEGTTMTEKVEKQVVVLRGWQQDEAEEYSLSNIPMGRNTDVNEVATAIYAIGQLPSYINGACIDMTGGQ